jgi:hypothetical protein
MEPFLFGTPPHKRTIARAFTLALLPRSVSHFTPQEYSQLLALILNSHGQHEAVRISIWPPAARSRYSFLPSINRADVTRMAIPSLEPALQLSPVATGFYVAQQAFDNIRIGLCAFDLPRVIGSLAGQRAL